MGVRFTSYWDAMIYAKGEALVYKSSTSLVVLLTVLLPLLTLSATADDSQITIPPAESGFDEFYAKHISVDGFPVISSAKVHDAALREAASSMPVRA